MTVLAGPLAGPPTALAGGRDPTSDAALTEVDGRTVATFRVGPPAADGDAAAQAATVERALELAAATGVPVLGVVHSIAAGPADVAAVTAWGRVARRAVALSGVVPLLVAVTGPCHGGLAPILGLADHVVFTAEASAYINGPRSVAAMTGMVTTGGGLGGPSVHHTSSGLAALVVGTEEEAFAALADLLGYLPDNWLAEPPRGPCLDPPDRRCHRSAGAVPSGAKAAYDVRTVVADVVDEGTLLEVHAAHAANVVTAYARVAGRPVAVIANQPAQRAGTLDIAASSKAARHVQGADAANLPILTFVDTPGFEPGRDLEWRGMIRHGGELVHAYAAATTPRVCVVLRKAYGGAYIVMDSKGLGSDVVLAWPSAEIAVMGAQGAVSVLNRRELAEADDPVSARAELEAAYSDQFLSPCIAHQRGYVDAVIDPVTTRHHVAAALARLATKQARVPDRRHSNTPC